MKDFAKFIRFVAIMAIGLYVFNELFKKPILSLGLISLVIYGLYFVWDKRLWRYKKHYVPQLAAALIGLHNFPDLNGKWSIEYWSSYEYDYDNNRYTQTGTGTADIEQTYSELFVSGRFGDLSGFASYFSQLKEHENHRWYLVYGYRNNTISTSLQQFPSGGMHDGFCYLEMRDDKTLEGYYTNDENRKTRGKIVLTRIS